MTIKTRVCFSQPLARENFNLSIWFQSVFHGLFAILVLLGFFLLLLLFCSLPEANNTSREKQGPKKKKKRSRLSEEKTGSGEEVRRGPGGRGGWDGDR